MTRRRTFPNNRNRNNSNRGRSSSRSISIPLHHHAEQEVGVLHHQQHQHQPPQHVDDDDDDNGCSSDGGGGHRGHRRRRWTAEQLSLASYKDLGEPNEVEDQFLTYLLSSSICDESLWYLLKQSNTTTRDYSITIDTFDLIEYNPILGYLLLQYPSTLLPILELAIVRAQHALLVQYHDNQQQQQNQQVEGGDEQQQQQHNFAIKGMENNTPVSTARGREGQVGSTTTTLSSTTTVTSRIHARLIHLPPYCCKTSVMSLQAQDVGKIIQVAGTVVRTSPVQMYESARLYQCIGKSGCQRTFVIHADMEQRHNTLQPPIQCPLRCQQQQQQTKCLGSNIQIVENGSVHTDYQEIKIQETMNNISIGHIPRSLLIKLQHDLVDQCQPGDQVIVVGVLLAQWHQPSIIPDVECQVGVALSAHSIRVISESNHHSSYSSSAMNSTTTGIVTNSVVGQLDTYKKEFDLFWNYPPHHEQHQQQQQVQRHVLYPIKYRDSIVQAVCPKLYGMKIIKLALLMTIIGGVSAKNNNDTVGGGMISSSRKSDNDADTNIDDDGQPVPFEILSDSPERSHSATTTSAYYGNSSAHADSTIGGNGGSSGTTTSRHHDNHHPRRSHHSREQVKTRRRDQSHLLLVGDPGTGKSQFLRFAAALCPRSVLTTGVGTTSAGLTCAAVREGNGKDFALEAGALVLADQGICCIDEFGCIREQDRTTIHEAMEQQTLSVAKAGIVCKLNCRATIIAVMNPRDSLYDPHATLSRNTGLGTPLLSRFDLIFKLMDTSDADRDCNVTTYLLNRAIQGGETTATILPESVTNEMSTSNNQFSNSTTTTNSSDSTNSIWSMEKLRAYISIVKERYEPVMSDEAAKLIERHYEVCRSARNDTLPVTVRFLESLIRLSQAHARLMYRDQVLLEDAVAAIEVMECSAGACGGFDNTSGFSMYVDPMTVGFSEDPDTEFLCFEYRLLERYEMLGLLSTELQLRAVSLLSAKTNMTGPTSWSDVESGAVESYHPDTTQDHYGRTYTDGGSSGKRSRLS